jgi:hypothetical protein
MRLVRTFPKNIRDLAEEVDRSRVVLAEKSVRLFHLLLQIQRFERTQFDRLSLDLRRSFGWIHRFRGQPSTAQLPTDPLDVDVAAGAAWSLGQRFEMGEQVQC